MPSGPASAVGGFVPPPKFEDYREQFRDHVIMERRNGVLMLRFHTQGKALLWTPQIHRAIHQAVRVAAADPQNEVIIVTGTGDFWVAYGAMPDQPGGTAIPEDGLEQRANSSMDIFVGDGIPLQESLVYDVRVPTIAAINGPGYHMDFGLMCDLVICTDDTVMLDVHRWMGFVSGDGINIAYQELMGSKRANYAMLMGNPVTAQQALDWGMVNEVVPRERIYDRAWELAAEIMRGGRDRRAYRRMMVEIMRKPLKVRMAQDFTGAFAAEMYAYMADPGVSHDDEGITEMWQNSGVDVPPW